MSEIKRRIIFLLGIGFFSHGIDAVGSDSFYTDMKLGPYSVGLRLDETVDGSRSFEPRFFSGSHDHVQMHGRPVQVYIWYPARESDGSSFMDIGDYADLASFDFGDNVRKHDRNPVQKYWDLPLARGFTEQGFRSLLRRKTAAVQDAVPDTGPFPLIVLGQGLYYESPITHVILCEYLASHGYVVATCPLVGTHSRLVLLNPVDLETQIRDMEYVLSHVSQFPHADQERIGLMGFDLGGMSALVLAMRNAHVDALASLDAGILFNHPSGLPGDSPHYDVDRFRIPWMHMTQSRFVEDQNLEESLWALRYRLGLRRRSSRSTAASHLASIGQRPSSTSRRSSRPNRVRSASAFGASSIAARHRRIRSALVGSRFTEIQPSESSL